MGVLSGFDRLRLTASLRELYKPAIMMSYLYRANVLLKDFAGYVTHWTDRVRASAVALAEKTGRPVTYLNRSSERKEALARKQAMDEGVSEGLIGVWSCVEPCWTYTVRRDREQKKLVLHLGPSKCLHYYFYQHHAVLGFLHVRVQTWFPFQVSVCINGRHWLARQMNQAGIAYKQRENCFTWIEDVAKAQALARTQLESCWPKLLQPLLEECHPLAPELCRPLGLYYYWSVNQSEYATDVIFKSHEVLAELYPSLVHHGIKHFGSTDVMRFLGHKVTAAGRVNPNYKGEVLSDLKHRPEGIRLKHQASGNTLKMYDKQGSVLRVETTLNHPHQYRIYRASEKNPDGPKRWQVLRKGVSDLHRRAEVSEASNRRYLSALASVRSGEALGQLSAELCRPLIKKGRRYRALNPWSEKDSELLSAISGGDWMLNGFRNRDIRLALYGQSPDPKQQRRSAARVTRQLGLLRAHGLIKKVSGTHRYVVTTEGRRILTALLTARDADVQQLAKLAA